MSTEIPVRFQQWQEDRAHLVVERDGEWPAIFGCDCNIARDHYEEQAP